MQFLNNISVARESTSLMLQKDLPLSEPEGECSDCSSYEELTSNSEQEIEEVILYEKDMENKSSSSSASSNYRSWYSSRRRGSRASNNLSVKSSKDSLSVINENQKNWWYWMKLAIFISTPFIARQLGIMVGKRILSKTFKSA